MRRQVLISLWCWLTIGANGEENKAVNLTVEDNVSAESASQLYPDVTFKVYARNSPYSSYKFGVLNEPVNSGSHLVPVKEESLVLSSQTGVLKDSYGNKFVETPQKVAYKMTYPQQYVRLQDLPVHLSQPLVAVPGFHVPSFSHGPVRPNFVTPTPIVRHYNPSQAQLYAGNIKNYAPVQGSYFFPTGSPRQQSSNSKVVYSNQPNHFEEPKKFQRLVHSIDNAPLEKKTLQKPSQSAPTKQVATPDNGKKATFLFASKPPLPLLNLNLLQPLTFANPIVPQVQHFLPKINYNLPEVESHNHNNEFVIQKTKSYDTGIISDEPNNDDDDDDGDDEDGEDGDSDDGDDDDDGNVNDNVHPPPKPSKTPEQDNSGETKPTRTSKPSITVNGNRGGPEYSYEINSPNYKESYNEKAVSYGNKAEDKPVHYSYNKLIMKKPVSYSVTTSSNSKDPSKNVYVEVHNYGSKQMIYSKPVNHIHSKQKEHSPQNSYSNESGENNSGETNEEIPKHHSQLVENENHHKTDPRHFSQGSHHESPRHYSSHENYHEPRHNSSFKSYHDETPKHHTSTEIVSNPKPSHHLKPEHREEQYNGAQNNGVTHNYHGITHNRPSPQYSQPIKAPHSSPPLKQSPSPQYYEEDIHIVQSHVPNSPIQVYPRQQQQNHVVNYNVQTQNHQQPAQIHSYEKSNNDGHRQLPQVIYHQSNSQTHATQKPNTQVHHYHPQSLPPRPPQQYNHEPQYHHLAPQQNHQHNHQHHHQPQEQRQYTAPQPTTTYDSSPHIVEKSRKIIIQEETPDEMHSHREQMVAEMVDQEENNEEDFEKAFKDAAIGFPAYERNNEQIEKDIYNPENYGIPKHDDFDFENSPFQQYQKETDEFPKRARTGYKVARDDAKEDYYLDYSVSRPERLLDMHKSKINYYKNYKSQNPSAVYFRDEPEKKQKKSESYTAYPSDFGYQSHPKQKKQSYFAQYKEAPQYEYDYSKEAPRDSYAYPSGISRKSKTLFVEPQFQYGFEPISLPLLLDSELSAMATNDSPESEKAGTRKKLYKENWYITKTSTSGSKPAS